MQGIQIEYIPSKVPDDPRGEVFELFKGKPGRQVTLYTRVANTAFGNHFHRGDDPSKDPELIFIISGSCELYALNGFTGEEMRETVGEHTLISIQKGIYHELVAQTDVIFMEYRSTVFDPEHPDTYPKEAYEGYIQELKM